MPTTRYVSAYDDTVSEVAPSLPEPPVTCLSFGLTSKFDFFFWKGAVEFIDAPAMVNYLVFELHVLEIKFDLLTYCKSLPFLL